MLAATIDRYQGVEVTMERLPNSAETFRQLLDLSLDAWTSAGYRRVWLRVPPDKSPLIAVAIEAGFAYHQVLKTDLMLVKPLIDGAFIPSAASHYIGAGGVVINDKNELLTIVERNASRPDYYKLPGGMVDEGEHLADGVIREVFEETGVRTAFESVVFMRQTHETQYFGRSNYYIICKLRPISADITIDPVEIAYSTWMPVEDYLNNPVIADFEKLLVHAALATDGLQRGWLPGYYRKPEHCELFVPPNVKQFQYES